MKRAAIQITLLLLVGTGIAQVYSTDFESGSTTWSPTGNNCNWLVGDSSGLSGPVLKYTGNSTSFLGASMEKCGVYSAYLIFMGTMDLSDYTSLNISFDYFNGTDLLNSPFPDGVIDVTYTTGGCSGFSLGFSSIYDNDDTGWFQHSATIPVQALVNDACIWDLRMQELTMW